MYISIGVGSLLASHFVTLITCSFLPFLIPCFNQADRRTNEQDVHTCPNFHSMKMHATKLFSFRLRLQAKCFQINCHLSSPGQSILGNGAAAAAPIVIDVLIYLLVVFVLRTSPCSPLLPKNWVDVERLALLFMPRYT